jgi:hypothetical protein
MNILKDIKHKEPDFFKHAIQTLGLKSCFDSFVQKGNRFFSTQVIEKHLLLTPHEPAFDYLQAVQALSPLMRLEYVGLLMEMKHPQKISLVHRNDILSFAFLDLILTLKTIQQDTADKEALFHYLSLHLQNPALIQKIKAEQSRAKSTIYLANRDSSIIHVANPLESRRTVKVWLDNQALIKNSPLISFVEISKDIDNTKLNAFLVSLNAISAQVLQLIAKEGYSLSEGLKFGLRLRKIKHTYKRGIFLPAQNVIVLDPRHTDSLTHEIGHWYHTHFKPEIKKVQDCEIFAENFYKSLSAA